jgi:hypothetical protein
MAGGIGRRTAFLCEPGTRRQEDDTRPRRRDHCQRANMPPTSSTPATRWATGPVTYHAAILRTVPFVS